MSRPSWWDRMWEPFWAERALSPGVNDPTTAAQVIGTLHGLLRPMVRRHVPNADVTDDTGRVRLVDRPQTAEDHLRPAATEISRWGGSSIRTPARLRAVLDDLGDVAVPQ